MGVDFYTCDVCGDNYPDCGPCGICTDCGANLCGNCTDEACEKHGISADGESYPKKCQLCSGDVVTDETLVRYFLGYYKLDRKSAEKLAKKYLFKK